MILVEQTGPSALVQDLGRPGLAHLGVSPSGAADRAAMRLGNRLVGNDEAAAGIECLFGGLVVVTTDLRWVAVTGPPTQITVNGTPVGSHSALVLRPGDRLTVGRPAWGIRNYLAVRGGIAVPVTLGSRSTDVLSGLGPAPLTPGQALPVDEPRHRLPDTDLVPPSEPSRTLRLLPGPRRGWFGEDAWAALLRTGWTVGADSNRVAVRLEGPPLPRVRDDELPSEGLVRGAVQVPASGQPLIFGADHPVTGGYPVIAVLAESDNDHAAQLRPGEQVHFVASAPRGWLSVTQV